MEDFFSTLYYYTNGLYSAELDTYLYETIPGYLHLGLLCVAVSFVISALKTPLINNEIAPELEWSSLDCFGLCIANVIWSLVFYLVAALILKWKSVAKYIPFKKF